MTDMYEQLTNVYYQLIDKAHDARAASYCPYSGIAVGAALLTATGKIYTGANIENASYSPTICAERAAFFKAVNAGERDFVAIAIAGAKADEEPVGNFPPCGVCRQVMSEFCGPDFMIILGTRENFELVPFSDLMPHTFTKDNLESPKAPTNFGTQGINFDEYEDEYDEEYDDEYEEDYDDEDYDEDELDEDEYEEEDEPEVEKEEDFDAFDAEGLHELADRWEI